MQGTFQSVDGRSALRFERRLAHSPRKVWRAITEPDHLAQWFPSEVSMDFKVGGVVRFDFRAGEAPALEGRITEFDPPNLLAYSWGDDLLRFELRPEGTGCLLIFTHIFDDRAGAASFAAGWQTCLAALDALLADRPIEPPGDMNQLHQEYIEAFGMDRGSVEQTADGWRVCFERQLTRPIEQVWAILSTSTTPTAGGAVPRGFTTPQIAAGAITAVGAPRLLEYDWQFEGRTAGRVRWELTDGTGHGARLILAQTGPDELAAARPVALAAWQAHIEQLARQLLGEGTAGDDLEAGRSAH